MTLQFTAKLLLLQWVIVFTFSLPLATCKWWQVKSFLSSLWDSAFACSLAQIPSQQERLKTASHSSPCSYGCLWSLFPLKTFFSGGSLRSHVCDAVPILGSCSSTLTRLCLLIPIHWALCNLCIYTEFTQASRLMNVNLNMSLNLKVLDQNTLKLCLDLKSTSRVQFCKWTLFFLCGKTNQRLKSGLAFECHKVLPFLEMNLFLKRTPY